MPKPAKITFIICTYNRAGYLKETLESLLDCESPAHPVEILVVDNNSKDETADIVNRYTVDITPNIAIRYTEETKQGLSHARNRGVKAAQAEIVIFIDDDIRATTSYLNSWLQFFEKNPKIEAAGGKIHVRFDDPRPEWMSRFLLPLLGHHDFGNSIKPYRKTNYPFGGNMAFKKEIFSRNGFFDTELGRIGKDLKASEEKEFFQRLKQNGVEIYYVPGAKLYHRVNASRLSREYIRRQAIGLGQSMALQLKNQSPVSKFSKISVEFGKWLVSIGLFIPYTMVMKSSKAVMLLRFRKWIAEGFLSVK